MSVKIYTEKKNHFMSILETPSCNRKHFDLLSHTHLLACLYRAWNSLLLEIILLYSKKMDCQMEVLMSLTITKWEITSYRNKKNVSSSLSISYQIHEYKLIVKTSNNVVKSESPPSQYPFPPLEVCCVCPPPFLYVCNNTCVYCLRPTALIFLCS